MDLFKFPFLSDVWGTVSDWVMIAVTTITAIFLYKTLKSQKEVHGDSDEPDHLIPGQADHQFRGKLTRGFRDKLTTLNV
ncbi:MAG: hypothetical protein M3O71_01965 [Bacteroidota bacterium]|nr:hypothetical protein [Bacteroidota bacterium]